VLLVLLVLFFRLLLAVVADVADVAFIAVGMLLVLYLPLLLLAKRRREQHLSWQYLLVLWTV
jgi:hypothetical protein